MGAIMEKKEEKEKEDSKTLSVEERKNFTPQGKFAKGNIIGRIRKKVYNKDDFANAMYQVGTINGKDYLLNILEWNYKTHALDKVILDKCVEDASIASLGKAIQIGNTIILQFTGYQPKPEAPIVEILQEESKDSKE
jgi:hypothetical protein